MPYLTSVSASVPDLEGKVDGSPCGSVRIQNHRCRPWMSPRRGHEPGRPNDQPTLGARPVAQDAAQHRSRIAMAAIILRADAAIICSHLVMQPLHKVATVVGFLRWASWSAERTASMSAATTGARRAGLTRLITSVVLVAIVTGVVLVALRPLATLAASRPMSSISAANVDSCGIENGKAYCWGDNGMGQLGAASTAAYSSLPLAVDTSGALAGKTLTQISVGFQDACALDSAGAVYCWGWNSEGELGDGSTATSSNVPVAVDTSGALAGKTITQISAGDQVTCALDSAGAAYCWGDNAFGVLGNGSDQNSSVPVAVDTSGALADQTLRQISAGQQDVCAVDVAGTAFCWGNNNYDGALGGGTGAASSSVPVPVDMGGVLAGKTLTQVSTGSDFACALDTAGAAYCWGDNNYGELGDGNTKISLVPVAVDTRGALAGKTITQISAWGQPCALDSAGSAYCWGRTAAASLATGVTRTPASQYPSTWPAFWRQASPKSAWVADTPARWTAAEPPTAGATTKRRPWRPQHQYERSAGTSRIRRCSSHQRRDRPGSPENQVRRRQRRRQIEWHENRDVGVQQKSGPELDHCYRRHDPHHWQVPGYPPRRKN